MDADALPFGAKLLWFSFNGGITVVIWGVILRSFNQLVDSIEGFGRTIVYVVTVPFVLFAVALSTGGLIAGGWGNTFEYFTFVLELGIKSLQ